MTNNCYDITSLFSIVISKHLSEVSGIITPAGLIIPMLYCLVVYVVWGRPKKFPPKQKAISYLRWKGRSSRQNCLWLCLAWCQLVWFLLDHLSLSRNVFLGPERCCPLATVAPNNLAEVNSHSGQICWKSTTHAFLLSHSFIKLYNKFLCRLYIVHIQYYKI